MGGLGAVSAPVEITRVRQSGADKHIEKIVRQQSGDPRFLEQVQRSIVGRRSLLGLDAPTRIAPTSPDGQEAYHQHVMHELMRLAEQTAAGPTIIDAEFVARQLHRELAQPEALTAEVQVDKVETVMEDSLNEPERD